MAATRENQLRDRRFERILIVKPSSLGDIIHALPVLNGLRVRYPDAHIAWLAANAFAPLIAGHPQLNEVILFDRKRFGRLGRGVSPSMQFIEFVHELRSRKFDLVIDLQGLFRSGFLAMASGAAVRIGFAGSRELAWVFYTHRIDSGGSDVHAVDKNYRVARHLGFDDVPIGFVLALTPEERAGASEILVNHGLGVNRPFAAVWPGARWETKRWSPERFGEVIDQLSNDHAMPTVLMGDPLERSLCDQIAGFAKRTQPVNLAGTTTIRQAAAVLERAAVVLTHDSAPMHIAAALGRPLVAILGPTNRHRTGPYRLTSAVLQAELPCVPCYLKQLTQCPYHHQCMYDVGVAGVTAAVVAALSSTRAAGNAHLNVPGYRGR